MFILVLKLVSSPKYLQPILNQTVTKGPSGFHAKWPQMADLTVLDAVGSTCSMNYQTGRICDSPEIMFRPIKFNPLEIQSRRFCVAVITSKNCMEIVVA